ncbi:MAG: DUF3857 domain-containing protein [Bacteroidota bacterium]|nr:DUF3857 domain-containing protein [Bacteroidota bacterium]
MTTLPKIFLSIYLVCNGLNPLMAVNVIIMNKDEHFKIKSLKKATYTRTVSMLVNNKEGLNNAILKINYSPFITLKHFEAKVTEAGTDKPKKYRLKDLEDHSYFGFESGFHSDIRFKSFVPEIKNFPAIVKYSYTIELKGFYTITPWIPVPDFEVSLIHAVYEITCPENYAFKTKYFQFNGNPQTEHIKKGLKRIVFRLNNFEALKKEPDAPHPDELFPIVIFASEKFYFDKYAGETKTWNEIAAFNQRLLQFNEIALSPETRRDIGLLKNQYPDQKELLSKLYSYFQNRTRYISIQLGIGGYKPMSPRLVDTYGYGDCKALSFYFKTIMDEAGIPSYYTLIYGGNHPFKLSEDFPFMGSFNHVVLFGIIQTDTLLIECTSQKDALGSISSFTANRSALLIDGKTATIVNTPMLPEPVINNNIRINIDSNNKALINFKSSGNELYQDICQMNAGDRKKYLKTLEVFEKINIADIECNAGIEKTIQLHGFIKNYAIHIDKDLLIPIFPNPVPVLASEMKRTMPFECSSDQNTNDTLVIVIPAGFRLNELLKGYKLRSKFGEYQCNFKESENSIIIIRYFKSKKSTFNASEYTDYVAFSKNINAFEKKKITLIKEIN